MPALKGVHSTSDLGTSGDRHVTFCVPAFNGASVIGDALRSIKRQTHQNYAVLISDDCSQDRTTDVCRPFLDDNRFELKAQPTRLGWVKNCNWLLDKAVGEFVCILPQDDVLAPCFAERLLDALATPRRIMAFSDIEAVGTRQGIVSAATIEGDRVERVGRFLRTHNDGLAFRGLLRRVVLEKTGGLRPNAMEGFAADVGWLSRIACCGEMVRVPEALYRKRYDAESTSARWRHWPPEKLVEAWCMHCCEIAESLLELDLPPHDLGALAPAWVERLLGLGFADYRRVLVSLSQEAQRGVVARTLASVATGYTQRSGSDPVPAGACRDFAALLVTLASVTLPTAAPSPPPPGPGLERLHDAQWRIARTPRNLVNFLLGRPLKTHSSQMRSAQTLAK